MDGMLPLLAVRAQLCSFADQWLLAGHSVAVPGDHGIVPVAESG